ncbi:MAG TPA: AraC family transcriptional regulator [Chryseolinea sp.]|nr:AraC family transcriptional regulator [Chryseolinea sp.]
MAEIYRKYLSEQEDKLEDQTDWGISVLTVGHNIHKAKTIYPDKSHPNSYYFDWEKGRILNEFQLVYISNGNGVFESETSGTTIVEAGTAFLLFPGIWHRYKPSEETGWEEFWVGYQGAYVNYLMKQTCFKTTSPFVHIGQNAELMSVFIKLIETVKYEGVAYRQFSSCLISQLLAIVYASAINSDAHRQNQNKLIHQARFKIHENLDKNINLEQVAKELGVSYPWFRRVFKAIIGVAPGQYHLNLRVEKACSLLKETDLTVGEIAFHLGFESEFYFSRIFKKKVGLPPKKYRFNVV